jgi:hypothetical protein
MQRLSEFAPRSRNIGNTCRYQAITLIENQRAPEFRASGPSTRRRAGSMSEMAIYRQLSEVGTSVTLSYSVRVANLRT